MNEWAVVIALAAVVGGAWLTRWMYQAGFRAGCIYVAAKVQGWIDEAPKGGEGE
ncbi:hypothetical protein [Lysobacter enzymogenes]|uniref:hypothetical protein n=1 Tax=Lysobacter enzymogenes TaxID=69 RepID=UPI001A959724|nr:hypothetical protein [Lysobacter enzymogenes]QQP96525.1 hypothetical protein JHW38_00255 [Lysobacter enzymogenes]